jgi:hypothetical protein
VTPLNYINVGAGSSGCVLASQLSEDPANIHADWRRGELSIQDKRRVLAAVVQPITINRGVRGRSIVGNRPEDRVVITWRPDTCAAV